MHIVRVIVIHAERIEVTHGDVRELCQIARHLIDQARRKAEAREIESLADVVAVIREAIEPVPDSQDGGGINREQVVELRSIDAALETPLVRTRKRGEFRVAGLERVITKITQAGAPPASEIF